VEGVPIRNARVLVAGVAYKPGVSDDRESPGREIIGHFEDLGARVEYFDPLVPSLVLRDGRRIESIVPSPQQSAFDIVVVCTLHPGIDYGWLAGASVVIDPAAQLRRNLARTGALA
jgi:UDP-N-acetyl-D-glucosamine dehydrogenase